MASYHLFVVAVRTDDATADALEGAILATTRGYVAGGPTPCGWAPDPDTVAEGLGCEFDLQVRDLNPAMPAAAPTIE